MYCTCNSQSCRRLPKKLGKKGGVATVHQRTCTSLEKRGRLDLLYRRGHRSVLEMYKNNGGWEITPERMWRTGVHAPHARHAVRFRGETRKRRAFRGSLIRPRLRRLLLAGVLAADSEGRHREDECRALCPRCRRRGTPRKSNGCVPRPRHGRRRAPRRDTLLRVYLQATWRPSGGFVANTEIL